MKKTQQKPINKDAFTRCQEKGGKIKTIVIDPSSKKRGRVCFLSGWGPVAERK